MFIIESYGAAVIFCLVTMLAWGSWANTQKLVGKWRFELFYWDYALGVLLASALFGITIGNLGSKGQSFFTNLGQADPWSLILAFLGGAVFNAANILLVAAVAIAGLSVAFPIAIGIAIIIGVALNYFAAPIGNPWVLFAGVAFIVAAIILDGIAYKKLPQQGVKTSTKGFTISLVSGLLMSLFYRFVAASMSSDFSNIEPGKLSPYAAVFMFAVGIFVSNFIFNTIMMKKPVEGPPLGAGDYFGGTSRLHTIGVIGGIIWGIGMVFSMIASGPAGYAISYGLGQGGTMVAALWGVFVWKEFAGAPKGTNKYVVAMFIGYLAGIAMIVVARAV